MWAGLWVELTGGGAEDVLGESAETGGGKLLRCTLTQNRNRGASPSASSPIALQERVWLVGVVPVTCFQARCLLQYWTPQCCGRTDIFHAVRWIGTAKYPLGGRMGRFTGLVPKFRLGRCSEFGSSFTSSGISMVLDSTRAERTFTTFCTSLREMANTKRTGPRLVGSSDKRSRSVSELGRTSRKKMPILSTETGMSMLCQPATLTSSWWTTRSRVS